MFYPRYSMFFDMHTMQACPDVGHAFDAAYITVTANSDSWPQTEHRIGLLEKRIQQLHEKYHYSFDMTRLVKWRHALKQNRTGK